MTGLLLGVLLGFTGASFIASFGHQDSRANQVSCAILAVAYAILVVGMS